MGASIAIVANLIFGWRAAPFDNYVVGYTLLAVSGPLVFLPCFQLSNAFPARSGLILSAVTGAFDASSLPYTIYKEVYQRSHYTPHLKTFFWCYSTIAVALVLQQIFLGQDEPYEEAIKEEDGAAQRAPTSQEAEESTALLIPRVNTPRPRMSRAASSGVRHIYRANASHQDAMEGQLQPNNIADQENDDPLSGMLHGHSATHQISSTWFAALTICICVVMVRFNFVGINSSLSGTLRLKVSCAVYSYDQRAACFLHQRQRTHR